MGDTLRSWLLHIIAAGMLTALLYALLPGGRVKAIAQCCGGLVMLLVVIRPLTEMEWGELTVSYQTYEQEIQELTETYRQANSEELASLIADRIGAYIASKGESLGLQCTAEVETEERDGVPYPCAVTMDIPRDGTLAAWIGQELDIDEAHQYWQTMREVDG